MRSATTVFWLRVTIPVNQELKVKEIVNPRMTFKVNGKAVELQPNDGQSSTFPSEAYFAVEPLIPGDKLEFHRRTHPKFKCLRSICILRIYFSFHATNSELSVHRVYYSIAPPSTGITAPVMYDAISLARKSAALAISSASPILARGIF